MTNILLDPLILLAPEAHAGQEEVERWTSTLHLWLGEMFDSPHHWYYCADVLLKYFGYERFPTFRQLRFWQITYQIEIDIPEIMRYRDEVFLRETGGIKHTLESQFLQLGYILELRSETTTIAPLFLFERWPEILRDEMSWTLGMVGAGKWKGDPFSSNLSLATLSMPHTPETVEIRGTVLCLSNNEESSEYTFAANVPLLYQPERAFFFERISQGKWGEQELQQAIERRFQEDWQDQGRGSLPFQFGPHFLSSIRHYRLEADSVLLSKMVYLAAAIIANKAMDLKCDLRHLRESKAVGSPQRTRQGDGAKAWRVTITNKGVGWRMHYWHRAIPGGSAIEFANVLKKHDPEIIY